MSGEGSSQGLKSNYKIINNQRGKTLLHAGHSYFWHRNNDNCTVWTCTNKKKIKCGGSVKFVEQLEFVHLKNVHSQECLPNFSKNEISVVMDKIQSEVCNDYSSVKKIVERNFMELKNKVDEADIPEYSSVKSKLYRIRNRDLKVPKTHFKDPMQVIIPEKFQTHLLIDHNENNNRILVFASNKAMTNIQDVEDYFGDGTFDCCPVPFTQIYTIQGDIGSGTEETNIVPFFYALLINKEGSTYETMLRKIKEALPGFNPVKFTTDFEVSAMNAIKGVFPQAVIRGCFVHFQRSIFRKAKLLGLLDHEETKSHVKMCISLAYLPNEDIDNGWISIMENSFPEENVVKFNDYFVDTWLEPFEMISKWCCYQERHRTTNIVEAWNQRLHRFLDRKPSLLSFLSTITIDISSYNTAQERLRAKGRAVIKRKKISIQTDQAIAKLTAQYKQKQIPIISFLQTISPVVTLKKFL